MVLWEMTVITAYFLGLKRTYKLALRIQRRLIGPNHPRIREFVYRRVRGAFDVAVKVHKNIQERDIEVGRNLGNWILRWLDRMKPSAQIRLHPGKDPAGTNEMPKHITSSSESFKTQNSNFKITDKESNGRQLFTSSNVRWRTFPTISMMMKPVNPGGMNGQYRHMSSLSPLASPMEKRRSLLEGVMRKDIAQWMLN